MRYLVHPLSVLRLGSRTAGKTTAFGQRIAMAGVATASRTNGKSNHWHGAGAAEFDMRSEYLAWVGCLGLLAAGCWLSGMLRRLKLRVESQVIR